MRMSELLKREPFGELLDDAVSRFCMYKGSSNSVKWFYRKPLFVKNSNNCQLWYANIYTNALFTKKCNSSAFEPFKREFSTSLIWWKVLMQKLYVQAAFSKMFASLLSQGTVIVSPGLQNSGNTVIIPGNHKIRILDFDAHCCFSIMKRGYLRRKLSDEIMWREKARSLNVPVPEIKEYSINKMIVSEEIVVGTPLNRLKKSEQSGFIRKALSSIHVLMENTAEKTTVLKYKEHLENEIGLRCLSETRIDSKTLFQIKAIVKTISIALVSEGDAALTIALTHGDFQPANILCNDTNVWLIDWEYCGMRQNEFDLIVYDLQARAPAGLAQRMKERITGCHNGEKYSSLVSYTLTKVRLFILEELLLRMYENSFDFLTCTDTGICLFVKEVNLFLENK
jgi:hypothetical protein